MRRRLLAFAAAGVIVTATGCSSTPQQPPTTTQSASADATTTQEAPPALPFDALPEIPEGKAANTPCPYVDSQFLADANGQRITGQGIDTRFDPPACVIWSYPDDPQLVIMVRHMDDAVQAKEVVDWAAPVATTNPANEPAGWTGGRAGNDQGSVYAVYKGATAVVVISNQAQSVKPQLVAEKVISNLQL